MEDTDRSRQLFEGLLLAESEEEVSEILQGELTQGLKWVPYGGSTSNIATAGAQQEDPVDAVAEKVVNSIDAHIFKGCLQRGVDPTSKEAPNSPKEAVKAFFGFEIIDLIEMSDADRQKLIRENLVAVVASGKNDRPCLSIVDNAEGQHPEDFHCTLLSLHDKGESRKDVIRCVQGRFNQGATGALFFCGEENYQLVVSRRHPDLLKEGQKDCWGFTVVRRQFPEDEWRSSWFEYFVDENDAILTFTADEIPLLPEGLEGLEPLKYGTIIKMFDYQFKSSYDIGLDFRRNIMRSLFDPVMPILLYEARQISGIEERGRTRFVTGNRSAVYRSTVEHEMLPIEMDLGVLGKRLVEVTVFDEPFSHPDFIDAKHSVFFTINGQTHHALDRNFIRSPKGANFYQLADVMMVHVDCSDISSRPRENLFMTSRDRARELPYYQEMVDALGKELHENPTLRALDRERARRKAVSRSKPLDSIKRVMGKLFKKNPRIQKLLTGMVGIPITASEDGGKKKFQGKHPPTFLKIKGWNDSKGRYEKHVPVGSFARVILETDAKNNYLSRSRDRGRYVYDPEDMIKSAHPPNDGEIHIKVVPFGLEQGERATVTFGLTNPIDDEVTDDLMVRFDVVAENPREPGKGGKGGKGKTKKNESKDVNLPDLIRVYKEQPDEVEGVSTWSALNWNEKDVVKVERYSVEVSDGEDQEALRVYINMDSEFLEGFLRRERVSKDREESVVNMYELTNYLFSLGLYNTLENGDRDDKIPLIMKGLQDLILQIVYDQSIFRE